LTRKQNKIRFSPFFSLQKEPTSRNAYNQRLPPSLTTLPSQYLHQHQQNHKAILSLKLSRTNTRIKNSNRSIPKKTENDSVQKINSNVYSGNKKNKNKKKKSDRQEEVRCESGGEWCGGTAVNGGGEIRRERE